MLLFLFIAALSLSPTLVFLKDLPEILDLDCFESGVFEDLTEAGVCPLTVSSEMTALLAR